MNGMLKLFSHEVYYLLDPGSTLSYVTLFMVMHFGFGSECISDPVSMSTPIVDFVIT